MAKLSIKQYVYKSAAAKRVPVSGTFELTSRCNLNCKMCYIHMSNAQQQSFGKELTTEQWLDIGRQATAAGMIYLLITGGEPMLRPDFLTIYTEMVKRGVIVSINTNGVCITPRIIECFKKYPPEQVNVSMYGTSPETYRELCGVESGYEATKRGIQMLKEAGIRVNINTTFTTCNESDLEELVEFAKNMQIPIRTAAYVFPKVRNGNEEQTVNLSPERHGQVAARFELLTAKEESKQRRAELIRKCIESQTDEEMAAESKASGCLAGRGAFWISWDGKMYPCGMLPTEDVNATQMSFEQAWTKTCQNMNTVFLPKECSVCQYRSLCPLCAAVTQSLSGDTAAVPEEMCRYIKAYCNEFLAKI